MASTQKILPRTQWQSFFDGIADALLGKRIEIEAASLAGGDQIVAEWIPLIGITYDSRDDLLDVAATGLDHLIRAPRDISVQEGEHGVESVAVVSADGTKHVLRLKEPLMLAGGSKRTS
jgi:hypothetical protein